MYRKTTRGIEVEVEPFYMADRSDPDVGRFFWGYRVTIDNQSEEFVQLLALLAHHGWMWQSGGGARCRRRW